MTEKEFLKNYDLSKFPRPSLTVDIAVFGLTKKAEKNYRQDEKRSLSILLIKRGGHPFLGKWALPGGFLNIDETIEECAFRELEEETHLKPTSLMPMGVFSEVNRDPRGRIISNAFISILDEENVKVLAGDDAREADWFKIEFTENKNKSVLLKLENSEKNILVTAKLKLKNTLFGHSEYEIVDSGSLAFDHAKIIASAISTIKRDADDFDILFDFMPPLFTLTGLQKVYESIKGHNISSPNFRRKVLPYVKGTDKFTSGAGHRPAELFKKKG